MIALLGLSACSPAAFALLDSVSDGKASQVKSATLNKAAGSLKRYCETVPYSTRIALRNDINSRTTNGDIRIDCEGDDKQG